MIGEPTSEDGVELAFIQTIHPAGVADETIHVRLRVMRLDGEGDRDVERDHILRDTAEQHANVHLPCMARQYKAPSCHQASKDCSVQVNRSSKVSKGEGLEGQ